MSDNNKLGKVDKSILAIAIITALPLVILAFITDRKILLDIGTGILITAGLYLVLAKNNKEKQKQ